VSSDAGKGGPKTWTQEDMELALDALRNHNMSLTKASATYGIPSTTLWQRAHRMGIDTPKKEGPTKSWTEENLNNALEALRTGTISANKASKAYGEFHWPYKSLLTCCWLYKTVSFVHLSRGHSFNTCSAQDVSHTVQTVAPK